ncbi:hypothetical protein OSB04_un001537 [Centaurea solstitialis]|uniref:Uncharacterized protein n=1 Tax=Centaurea solstitialis TaxID=347529 RepID=A0AA38SFZ2_9ASTR|nr:hypothetical protein OSB04_un001537 [Centaurea solstitialis]
MNVNRSTSDGDYFIVDGSCSKDKRLLGSLKFLNLSFCRQIRSVGGFFEIPALERLILANCDSLIEIFNPDMDLFEKRKANSIGISSQASSLALRETIGRRLESSLFLLPSSLLSLSLKSCKLSNSSFPMDFNCLSNLKTLHLDDNPIVSMPGCVRSLCKLEMLSMKNCNFLETVKHPPRTLRQLTLVMSNPRNQLQKLEFVPEMSPLILKVNMFSYTSSTLGGIEGILNVQPMSRVKEEVLCRLGWNNLEFIKNQKQKTWEMIRDKETSQIQMFYEFGIFSTFYGGEEIPNWISDRRVGSSISLTVPSSPNNLKGLNLCCVLDNSVKSLPLIIISNKTKNHMWLYSHNYIEEVNATEECLTYLSHWMFGKNEMEDGDQITITISTFEKYVIDDDFSMIREFRVSFVYDDEDGKKKIKDEEEDALGYYKSWNHIIGGDLSPFQTTTGEYLLAMTRFMFYSGTEVYQYYLPYVANGARLKGKFKWL